MTTTIQIRVDSETKKKADKTFKNMGLDMSSGVKLFLHQVVRSGSIPFIITTENGFSPAQEKQMIKESREAYKNGARYKSAKDMMNDVLK